MSYRTCISSERLLRMLINRFLNDSGAGKEVRYYRHF